ncbi:MAG: hypothetical protein DLM55_06925 [Acidimicrobiales bacterium]|nr:MAG: hypothetical protein DLM55_06925 [Acidimicrobiales bacterium]
MDLRQRLEGLPETFTRAEAISAGVSTRTLYRWRDARLVYEISRGIFRQSDSPETAYLDVLAACKRAPRAVVCLISALALHELTDEIPVAVHLAVPRGVALPKIDYPSVKVSRFHAQTFTLGIEQFTVSEGERVPTYNATRSVVDVMRMRRQIGDTIAYAALHAYLAHYGSPAQLSRYAATLGVAGPIRQALQVVLST